MTDLDTKIQDKILELTTLVADRRLGSDQTSRESLHRCLQAFLGSETGVYLLINLAPNYLRILRTLLEVYSHSQETYVDLRKHIMDLKKLAQTGKDAALVQELLDLMEDIEKGQPHG